MQILHAVDTCGEARPTHCLRGFPASIDAEQETSQTLMEANEISEFTEQVEKGGEANMREVSIVISILAVLVAMVTVMGHRTHTEAVLQQARASDMWNEYQAKNIRRSQIGATADLLSLQPNANQAAVEKKLAEYKARTDKWADDMKETQTQAKEYEADVAKAEKKASKYDIGEALLQIAVVLSSITLLTRQRLFVAFGALIGLAGLLIAGSALFVR